MTTTEHAEPLPSDSAIHKVASGESAGFSLGKTFYYSLGNAAGLITYNVFNAFITFFYTDEVALPAAWVGAGWLAFGFWNAVNDPIAGWLSDRTQSAFGRRKFYIRALAIPVAIAFALVWIPPVSVKEQGATAVLIYFLLIISIYDMLQSVITLNQDALFPELYQEHASRTKAASIRQFIGGVGTAVAVGMAPMIYDNFGWPAMAILFGSASALLHLLSLRGIHETRAFAEAADPSLRQQLRVLAENYSFRIIVGINFVTRFILAVLTLSLPFYAKFVLRIDDDQASYLIIAVTGAGIISLLFWQRVFKQVGTRRGMMVSLAIASLVAVPLFFTQSLLMTLIVLFALGVVVGGVFFLGPDLLFAEVVDEDFAKTGVRREGIYRGLLGFVFRFPPAFAGAVLLGTLDAVGYDADLAVAAQPDAVTAVVRGFVVFGCIAAVLAGLVLLYLYPLHGEHLAEIEQQSKRRRAEIEHSNLKEVNNG